MEVPPLPPACPCPRDYNPVCSKSNITFANHCTADCTKAVGAYAGECRKAAATVKPATASCACSKELMPVCGVDAKQYANKCLAACAKTEVAYPGACRPACAACPKGAQPYCMQSAAYGTPQTFRNCW